MAKYLMGLLTGVLLTFVFVQFGWRLPTEVISSEAEKAVAEWRLFDDQAPHEVRLRALAKLVSVDPTLLIEGKVTLEGDVYEDVLRGEALARAQELRNAFHDYERLAGQDHRHDWFKKLLQDRHGVGDWPTAMRLEVRDKMIEDRFLFGYLRKRYPEATKDDMVDIVLNSTGTDFVGPSSPQDDDWW